MSSAEGAFVSAKESAFSKEDTGVSDRTRKSLFLTLCVPYTALFVWVAGAVLNLTGNFPLTHSPVIAAAAFLYSTRELFTSIVSPLFIALL